MAEHIISLHQIFFFLRKCISFRIADKFFTYNGCTKTCDLYVSFISNIEENIDLCTNTVECEFLKMEE